MVAVIAIDSDCGSSSSSSSSIIGSNQSRMLQNTDKFKNHNTIIANSALKEILKLISAAYKVFCLIK